MKAPEKIYVHEASTPELTEKLPYHVEYTRTDAFMEKARKWFEKQNEWFDPNGNRHCDLTDFEDFKNFIKEE